MEEKEEQVLVYKNVFTRKDSFYFPLEKYLKSPEKILSKFNVTKEQINYIKKEKNKESRNILKRQILPAVDLSFSNLLTIDIDNIKNESKKESIIKKLSSIKSCLRIEESISGNLVAFFKYDCNPEDFSFLYYKLYLELTLKLEINIDFLPEINRLRYINAGKVYYHNRDAIILTEVLRVDHLPYISTQFKNKTKRVIYGSR